jgi:class 3 adenylate cyclase
MASEAVERRLAAILSADMAGFSRLMESDEEGTIARQKRYRAELIDPTIDKLNGRIVKTTGDGMLVEFASVVDAVRCAAEIQEAMTAREAETPEAERIRYRIGINLGDIVIEGGDILGEGVNIAARLEGLSEPGGLCIADVVHQSIEGKLDLTFDDLGQQSVKNLARPVHAWRWRMGGSAAGGSGAADAKSAEQDIRICLAPDGVQIAYAAVGAGPPLVKAPNWMNHLEYDWESPVWRHFMLELAREHRLIRFDQRGNGLSRSLRSRPGDGGRGHRAGDLSAARYLPGGFDLDRLRRPQSRTGDGARPLWRLRPGTAPARLQGRGRAGGRFHHPDPARLGPGQSLVSPAFHLRLHARGHAGPDDLVQ